jgi:protein involved in polysaccharide export with SLBB domain
MRRIFVLSFLALVVTAVGVPAQTKEETAPPSVSCLGPEGESYIRELLARIHQLETELEAEKQARLAESTRTDRRQQEKEAELSDRATALTELERANAAELAAAKQDLDKLKTANAAAADVEKRCAAEVETAQREIDKLRSSASAAADAERQLAEIKRALEEANDARHQADDEAAAAKRAAAREAQAREQIERRLADVERRQSVAEASRRREVAPPPPKESTTASAAPATVAAPSEPAPTSHAPTPAMGASKLSDSELATAQLAALSGKSTAPSETKPRASSDSRRGERILPGERLTLRAAKVDELNRTVEVGDDGAIDLPLVGSIQAAGRTETELVADLQERLTAYVKEPHVEVSREHQAEAAAPPEPAPTAAAAPTVSAAEAPVTGAGTYAVEGWVAQPGEYRLKGHTTLSAAIAQAGGPSFSARLDEIEIEHTAGGSEARREIINVAKISEKGGKDITIHSGDVVRVPGPVLLSLPWAIVRIITFPFWYPFS